MQAKNTFDKVWIASACTNPSLTFNDFTELCIENNLCSKEAQHTFVGYDDQPETYLHYMNKLMKNQNRINMVISRLQECGLYVTHFSKLVDRIFKAGPECDLKNARGKTYLVFFLIKF